MRWLVAPQLALLLVGCIDSGLEDTESEALSPAEAAALPDNAYFDADGAAVQVLDATKNDVWVYYDLDTYSVVTLQDPQANTEWDLAFNRFRVKLNGGVSGTAGVAAAGLQNTALFDVMAAPATGFVSDRSLNELSDIELLKLGDNLFFSVCASGHDDADKADYCLANDQVDRSHLNPDEAAYALLTQGSGVVVAADGSDGDPILGWYDYYGSEGHVLRPADDTWVVRSSDGIEFALQMLGYYGRNEGDAEPGTIAFRYVSLTPGFEIPQPGAQQLQARIQVDSLTGTAPLTVNFTGSAEGVEGTADWHWDFGDGGTAQVRNPAHTYTQAGTYTASLTVTDTRGVAAAATVSRTITVAQPGAQAPQADAGADQTLQLASGENSTTVTLDGSASADPDGQIVSYVWIGTGADPDDVAQPQLVLSAGSYSFTLTVTDDSGNSATDTAAVTVNASDNASPTAAAQADRLQGAAPLAVTFTGAASSDPDGAITGYDWDFGDGSAHAFVAVPPAHTYTLPGTYNASLTVMDDGGASGSDGLAVLVGWPTTRDTYVYEFLGNQADATGDSGGFNIWNHSSEHGGKALLDFDDSLLNAAALAGGPGTYTATLWLYSVCELGGLVAACPGDADADNPFTPGTATVKTDVLLQTRNWDEAGAIDWADIDETGAPVATLTQATTGQWHSVDITAHVEHWVNAGTTGAGLALSQEAYPVLRADNGSIPVAVFCDAESSSGACSADNFRPYIILQAAP
ncbi:hypothetical protein TspCOW1_15360 [Thiohalobacter sp. COW1]|uniref:PKD domain-containing protein n=2 Tax=Thiohalobacteraceae TaxID=3085110 RepID=A0A1Z4VPV1_9GAMM|nr:uncharacterized protein FOKN1_1126 [Thiohalobacter thiocyanaticus]BCO31433.1 hypothetical protein TspCOW1_15360 [Thiohalobacter sp. COW1]